MLCECLLAECLHKYSAHDRNLTRFVQWSHASINVLSHFVGKRHYAMSPTCRSVAWHRVSSSPDRPADYFCTLIKHISFIRVPQHYDRGYGHEITVAVKHTHTHTPAAENRSCVQSVQPVPESCSRIIFTSNF